MVVMAQYEIVSPNETVALKFWLSDKGRPMYSMTYKGKAVVNPSGLGLELAKDKHASAGSDETDLMEDFRIVDQQLSSFDGPTSALYIKERMVNLDWL